MSLADREILNRWVGERDVEAFQTIVQRYARMVYATCRRILGDAAEAEDVTQECFEALVQARKTREIKALGPWLHGMATKRSLMRIRAAGRRRDREAAYGAAQPVSVEPVWDDIYALVDEAIAELPDKFRGPVVAHFLRGESHAAIARATGTPRRTVSKRIEVGLARIGEALKGRGVSVPSVTLSGLLAANLARAEALPETLGAALGKLSLAQSGKGAAAATAPVMSSLTTKGLLAAVVVAVAGTAVWVVAGGGRAEPVERLQEAVAGERSAETVDPILVPAPEPVALTREVPEPPAVALATNNTETRDTPALGTVSGYVYRDEIVPLEGARVIVYAPGTERDELAENEAAQFFDPMWGAMVHPGNAFYGESDEEGFFRITGIPSDGDARLHVYHKGYVDDGRNIEVVAGEERKMNVALVRGGESVTGVLLSQSGAPVTDAAVYGLSFLREDSVGGGPHQAGYTDQSGGFHLPVALKDTERAVAIIMAKSKTLGNALFENVDVCPEDSITLRYPNRTSLRGNVAMPGDASASGLQVMLEGTYIGFVGKQYGMDYWHESTEVKPDGSYAFDRLDPKPIYKVKVLGLDGKEMPLDRNFLELRPTATNTVNLRVEESAWVIGRVYGVQSLRPIPDVRVRCKGVASPAAEFDDSLRMEFTAKTDSEGNYRLEVLRGWGAFQIMADYGGDKSFGRTPARLVEELEIRPGGEYNVNLPLPTPWSRSFLVQDGAGNPLPAARIQLNTRALDGFGGDSYSVDQTDSDGRATLSTLDPGCEISVRFRKDGYLRVETAYLSGKPGETFPMETIVLQRVSEAVATLVDGNNVAFADRQVKVYLYSNGDLDLTIDTSTDGRGRIRRDPQVPIADLLPDAGEISFELEIEDPAVDGQDGVIYRSSNHLLLPEDEMEDMGTIVLEPIVAGAAQ